jgi:hypothetical protein
MARWSHQSTGSGRASRWISSCGGGKGLPKNTAGSKPAGQLIPARKQRCYLNPFRVIQEMPGYQGAS